MWPSRPAADRSGVRPSRTTRLPAPAPASTTAGRCARTAWRQRRLAGHIVGLAGGRDQRTDVQRHGHAPARVQGASGASDGASAKRMPLTSGVQDGGVQRLARQRDVGARRRRRGARPRHTARWCCMGRCRRTGTRRPAPCRSRRALHAPRPPQRRQVGGQRRRGARRSSAQARSRKARRPASACRVAVISAPGIRARPPPARWRRARGRAAARAGCRAAPSRSVAPSPH